MSYEEYAPLIIHIDPYSGVGFSYSEVPIDFVHNDQTTTSHKWATLAKCELFDQILASLSWSFSLQFLIKFFDFYPEFANSPFWVAGSVCHKIINQQELRVCRYQASTFLHIYSHHYYYTYLVVTLHFTWMFFAARA